MKLLIAEDDFNIRKALREILESEGYQVQDCDNGRSALEILEHYPAQLVLLDIMMPEVDGYDVCRRLRTAGNTVPVIFISAKSEEIDRVLGLELGADDFISKPFGVREVVARIRAVTRRCLASAAPQPEQATFTLGDLEIIPAELRARRHEHTIELSLRDIRLLRCLADRPGEVVSRDDLFNAGWGRDYLPSSRTLDQHLSKLRKLVEVDPKTPRLITTVHGAGYRFPG